MIKRNSLILLFAVIAGICLSSCNTSKITVVGTALNSKGNAIIEVDKTIYVIDQLASWDAAFYGKNVKVTGRLKLVENKKKSTPEVQVQERVGTVRIIKHAKWSLVE